MPELLIELGCEELPASFVQKAYTDLHDGLRAALEKSGVLTAEHRSLAMGTPRRLIVCFEQLHARQEDQAKEQRGPALKAAYDESGNPTPALLGFCKGAGVEPGDLRKDDQYVWATKTTVGRETAELLAEIIPAAIRGLNFEKSMRWGKARMRFARPIRWILAAFDGKPVEFEIETVQSGMSSRGHRFYSPESFEAKNLNSLLQELRARKVEPDPEIRRQRILDGAKAAAEGTPVLTDELVDENVFLTEWPTAVQGEFRDEFQVLPAPVLITAMAKHEKMFPVRHPEGALSNKFIFIRNSGEDETVRKGNEWVLNARFNDAKFFFDEDLKLSLDGFLEKTGGIVFQEKLGTVRQRAERLSRLAEEIARVSGADATEISFARNAGLYCKADLSAGLVNELPSLQGIVGGEYAAREGKIEEVCWAIASHYDLAKNPEPNTPGARTAIRVLMADQLDKLAGYLGIGLEPTGSSDPYGLRRAATLLIEAAWAWASPLPPFSALLEFGMGLYEGVELDSEGARASLASIFAARYEALLPNVRHDILDAAIGATPDQASNPRAVRMRIGCLETLAKDVVFTQTATRPINIVAAAAKKEIPFATEDPLETLDPEKLDSADGTALYQALKVRADEIKKAAEAERGADVDSLLRGLQRPINDFFASTMVMVEDEDLRYARLSLLQAACEQLILAGDFSKIVVEG